MPNIQAILRQINKDLVPEFERKLRAALAEQDREWLIEQIVRLTLDAHSLEENDRKHFHAEQTQKRRHQIERVRKMSLDRTGLSDFVQRYKDYSRDKLIGEKLLSKEAPPKGGELITGEFRSSDGNALLQHAKDLLFGFLYGNESTNTKLDRRQRQLLTLTTPRMKSEGLDFMKSTTELRATGTWQDPESGDNEVQADNVVLEIEYGESEDQAIGEGIITALRLINYLEINEEVLYGRMEKVEQSTLIS